MWIQRKEVFKGHAKGMVVIAEEGAPQLPRFTSEKLFTFHRKYEEIYPPEVDEFVYITDDTYTKRQLLRMEHLLLKVLAFDLTVPTTNQFLLQYLRRQGVCIRTENLAKVCYLTSRNLGTKENKISLSPSSVSSSFLISSLSWVQKNFFSNGRELILGS